MIQENTIIDWAARIVRVNRHGLIHNLSTIGQAISGSVDELESKVNCSSAKAFKRAQEEMNQRGYSLPWADLEGERTHHVSRGYGQEI